MKSSMKPTSKATLFVWVLRLSPFAFIVWICLDLFRNWGFELGYFGDFNRVGHALGRLPGVTITDSGYNGDVTLEEFTYEIKTQNGKTVELGFGESDPLRDMTGQQLADGLLARIRQQP